MIASKSSLISQITFKSFESDEEKKIEPIHFYYSKLTEVKLGSTRVDNLTGRDHTKEIDRQAWGISSKNVEARAVIFDAYIENLLIRLNELDDKVELSDVKEIIKTSQSYLRTVSKDPVSRMFIGNIVMCFRNDFSELSKNKITAIKQAVKKFQNSNRSFDSYRQYISMMHAAGINAIK